MMHRRRRRRRRRRVVLIGGLIAVGVYKLSKKDVERVEEHTGKTAEELSDQELEQAMDELGIDADEMTDEEMDEVDRQDPEVDDAGVGGDSGGDDDDYIDQLARLGELHEKGVLTDAEFDEQKKKLLGL